MSNVHNTQDQPPAATDPAVTPDATCGSAASVCWADSSIESQAPNEQSTDIRLVIGKDKDGDITYDNTKVLTADGTMINGISNVEFSLVAHPQKRPQLILTFTKFHVQSTPDYVEVNHVPKINVSIDSSQAFSRLSNDLRDKVVKSVNQSLQKHLPEFQSDQTTNHSKDPV